MPRPVKRAQLGDDLVDGARELRGVHYSARFVGPGEVAGVGAERVLGLGLRFAQDRGDLGHAPHARLVATDVAAVVPEHLDLARVLGLGVGAIDICQ